VKPCNAAQVEDQGIPGDKSLHNLLLILGWTWTWRKAEKPEINLSKITDSSKLTQSWYGHNVNAPSQSLVLGNDWQVRQIFGSSSHWQVLAHKMWKFYNHSRAWGDFTLSTNCTFFPSIMVWIKSCFTSALPNARKRTTSFKMSSSHWPGIYNVVDSFNNDHTTNHEHLFDLTSCGSIQNSEWRVFHLSPTQEE
jgi:hypothetical protein